MSRSPSPSWRRSANAAVGCWLGILSAVLLALTVFALWELIA